MLHQRRASQGYTDEYYRLYTLYRPDNAVALVLRAETADAAPVETTSLVGSRSLIRVFHVDSLGRRVGSVDPDSDSRDPSKDETNRTWRYLFNDVGDLIAVRDPRGCGQNFFYDHAGRLIAEDYVECDEVLPAGTRPVYPLPASAIAEGEIGSGTAQYVDARYYFDEEPEFTGGFVTAFFPTPHLVGRATGSVDRAQASVVVYDARGQAEVSVRIMSLITEARALDPTLPEDLDDDGVNSTSAPADQVFDNGNAYFTLTDYDNLGRPVRMTYPDVVDGTSVSNTTVRGRLSYNPLGLPTAVNLDVFHNGTGGTPAYTTPIVRDITYDANRLPIRIDYGDQSVTHDLHAEMRYDERLRVLRSWATRNAPATTGLNAVTRVHDFNYQWDAVSNLRGVTDARLNNEWGAGYRPWQQTIEHDALYRVNEIDIHYMDASGQWNPSYLDAATDWRSERTRPNQDGSTHEQRDPMRRRPAPMVSNNAPDRVRNLVYDYDWLANMTDWTDDAGVFYERSAGLLTSGNDAPDFSGWGPTHRPSALYLSTNISDAPGGPSSVSRGGYVWLDYGESGSVVGMTVHGQCHDRSETTLCQDLPPATSSFSDRKAALEAGCVCAQEQHYRYDWDELNRLAEARRYDRTGGSGPWDLAVQQRYRYDAANVRMIKETIDHSTSPFSAVTLTPYPGNFERRGLTLNTLDSTYDSSASLNSESQYTIGGARLVWGTDDPRTGELTRSQRLTLPLSDLVQSTAAVVDLQSGDLIEHTTFYPNGARETHLSTDEVSMQLEPVGFTGKEADEEVGLVYFGERYLIPRLGRWASVDPLSVHQLGGGEPLNGYHYVSGNLLQARDLLGLDGPPRGWRPVVVGRQPRQGTVQSEIVLIPIDGVSPAEFESYLRAWQALRLQSRSSWDANGDGQQVDGGARRERHVSGLPVERIMIQSAALGLTEVPIVAHYEREESGRVTRVRFEWPGVRPPSPPPQVARTEPSGYQTGDTGPHMPFDLMVGIQGAAHLNMIIFHWEVSFQLSYTTSGRYGLVMTSSSPDRHGNGLASGAGAGAGGVFGVGPPGAELTGPGWTFHTPGLDIGGPAGDSGGFYTVSHNVIDRGPGSYGYVENEASLLFGSEGSPQLQLDLPDPPDIE